jgi:hypothetical protein
MMIWRNGFRGAWRSWLIPSREMMTTMNVRGNAPDKIAAIIAGRKASDLKEKRRRKRKWKWKRKKRRRRRKKKRLRREGAATAAGGEGAVEGVPVEEGGRKHTLEILK